MATRVYLTVTGRTLAKTKCKVKIHVESRFIITYISATNNYSLDIMRPGDEKSTIYLISKTEGERVFMFFLRNERAVIADGTCYTLQKMKYLWYCSHAYKPDATDFSVLSQADSEDLLSGDIPTADEVLDGLDGIETIIEDATGQVGLPKFNQPILPPPKPKIIHDVSIDFFKLSDLKKKGEQLDKI